jgi:ankyrin repeat protein
LTALHEELNYISLNLDQPESVFSITNEIGQSLLHLSIFHRLPEKFIIDIIMQMDKNNLDKRDVRGLRAIDYLCDWPNISVEVLQAFITRGADFIEGQPSPVLQLCQRPADGCRLVELILGQNKVHLSGDLKKKMLEKAVKRGSVNTVELLLLSTDTDVKTSVRLFFEATKANFDRAAKVKLLSSSLPHPSQQNKAEQTLLHIAASGRPPKLDLLDLGLKLEIDPNIQDRKGDTALHKVIKNYAEQTTPWSMSEQAMNILLHAHTNLNLENGRGKTPLHNLMAAKVLPHHWLLRWAKKGALFVKPNEQKDVIKSPLADLCRRYDAQVLFKDISTFLPPDTLTSQTIDGLLQATVLHGSAEMVKVLLEYKTDALPETLLIMASYSSIDAATKIRYLYDKGARHTYKDFRGYSVLHHAAEAVTVDVVRACLDPRYLNLKLNLRNTYGNTPLHIAAMSKKDGSDVMIGLLAEKEQGGDPNALNRYKKSPFRLVLEHNHDRKELRRNKLMRLLERGCLPSKRDLEGYRGNADDFDNLFLSGELVMRSRNPIQLLLVLGWYCQSSATLKTSSEWQTVAQWSDLSDKCEEQALMIMEEFGKKEKVIAGVMTNKDVQEAKGLKWKKFFAHKYVGKMLNQMLFARVDSCTGEENPDGMIPWERKTWYKLPILTVVFLLECLLLSFYLPCKVFCESIGEETNQRKPHMIFTDPRKCPVVTVCGYFISYLVFLGFVISHIVQENVENIYAWNELVILLYVVSILLEETHQAYAFGRNYLTLPNLADDLKILFYCTFFVLRWIGMKNDDLGVLRFSEYVFAVAAMLSFFRLLYYLQINRHLGPILVSLAEIWSEVMSFLVLLGIVLISFAVALSGVYRAGVFYTTELEGNIGSFLSPAAGLWQSVRFLYWSLYGFSELGELQAGTGVLGLESSIALLVFALWLLFSIIVLLNMLIALITEAFDRVKKQNVTYVRNMAVSRVMAEVNSHPLLPLPLNIGYLVSTFIISLARMIFGRSSCSEENHKDDSDQLQLLEMPNAKRVLEAYRITKSRLERYEGNHLAEQNLEEVKKELQWKSHRTLVNQIRKLQRRLVAVTAPEIDGKDEAGRKLSKTDTCTLGRPQRCTDVFSDGEDEEQLNFRKAGCIGIDYDHKTVTVSYEGKNDTVGVCLFLDNPLSPTCSYFEIVVDQYGKNGRIGLGFAQIDYPLNTMPGYCEDSSSVAYHCDNGRLIYNGRSLHKNEADREFFKEDQMLSAPAQQGDVIGCGIRISKYSPVLDDWPVVFFTRNGEELGSLRVRLPTNGYFPCIGLCSEGATIKIKFNAEWRSPDNEHDGESFGALLNGNTVKRISSDRLTYTDGDCRLLYTGGLSQTKQSVGIFQDLGHAVSQGINYFEVKLLNLEDAGEIGIGVACRQHPPHQMPGWSEGSTAYHCISGSIFKNLSRQSCFPPTARGDVIGCGVYLSTSNSKLAKVFFTRNQVLFEDFEMDLSAYGLYPTIGMSSTGEEVQLNFDAKWPPQSSRTLYQHVRTTGNVIEYIGDKFRRIGAYQCLASPISREFFYFKVKIQDYGQEGRISIGLARKDYPLNKHPGCLEGSVALHCNDGDLFKDGKKLPAFLLPATEGDIVGCGVDYKESQKRMNRKLRAQTEDSTTELVVFFTLNGKLFDDATVTVNEPVGGLFPIVGLQTPGEKVEINVSPSSMLGQYSPNDRYDYSRARHSEVQIDFESGFASYKNNPCQLVGTLQYATNMAEINNYFEVSIVSLGDRGQISVGIATSDFPLGHQPGWQDGSIGFMCNEGYRYRDGDWVKDVKYHDVPKVSDVIGCGIRTDSYSDCYVIFTHNGVEIGNPLRLSSSYSPSKFFPTVSLLSQGETVKVNLGASWPSRDKSVFSRSEHVRSDALSVCYDSLDNSKIGAVQLKRDLTKRHPYFEVEVDGCGIECGIGVGLAPRDYPLGCLPGWRPGSIGYHCQDGCLFEGTDIGRPIGEPVSKGDKLGCGIDYQRSTSDEALIFFTHNNKILNLLCKLKWPLEGRKRMGFYPTVGMSSKGESVTVTPDARYKGLMSDTGALSLNIQQLEDESSC